MQALLVSDLWKLLKVSIEDFVFWSRELDWERLGHHIGPAYRTMSLRMPKYWAARVISEKHYFIVLKKENYNQDNIKYQENIESG